jgi:hypothetical protein
MNATVTTRSAVKWSPSSKERKEWQACRVANNVSLPVFVIEARVSLRPIVNQIGHLQSSTNMHINQPQVEP